MLLDIGGAICFMLGWVPAISPFIFWNELNPQCNYREIFFENFLLSDNCYCLSVTLPIRYFLGKTSRNPYIMSPPLPRAQPFSQNQQNQPEHQNDPATRHPCLVGPAAVYPAPPNAIRPSTACASTAAPLRPRPSSAGRCPRVQR